MSNDGSESHPWRTLAEVLNSKNKLIATRAYSGNCQKGNLNLYDENPRAPISLAM